MFVSPRLRVFENKVLRRIFGPTRDEVTGEWRRLHNEELDGFGGLVVRGFKPGRSRWIFRVSGKSSVCLPSEEK